LPNGDDTQVDELDRRIARRQSVAVGRMHRRHEVPRDVVQMGDALVLDRYGEEARLAEIFHVDVTLDLDLFGAHAFAQQRFLCLLDQVVERGVELVVVEFRFDLVQRLSEFVLHVDTNGAEG
jgi:hypothetical protein